jgi:signal transduction histidine kinase
MNFLKRTKSSLEDQYTHITQEMYKKNVDLNQRNRTLTLLKQIDEVVLQSADVNVNVASLITDLLVGEESEFKLAIIYMADPTNITGRCTAFSVQKNQVLSDKIIHIKDRLGTVKLQNAKITSLSLAVLSNDIQQTTKFSEIKDGLKPEEEQELKGVLGIETLFACPLKSSKRILGAMILGSEEEKDKVDAYTIDLVKRLTGTISIAMTNHMLYTELQEATQQLREANAHLKQLDEIKNEFLSMATHQLNTPLVVVDGYLSMMSDGTIKDPKDQHDLLEKMLHRVRMMKHLVSDFLNVSRIEAGTFVVEPTPVDLNKMVMDQVNELGPEAQEKEVLLQFIAPKHPLPLVEVDEQKISQAVMNLIDNAIYYTPKGTVNVYLDIDNKDIVFKVVDSGIGVPESQKSKLFQKFARADNARKARPNGNGVGLYLVKLVVEAHGGSIIFESTEGKGSTFGFRIPAKAKEYLEPSAPAPKLEEKEPVHA